jgi:cytochrome P450
LPVLGPTLALLRDPIAYHLAANRKFGPIYRTSYLGKESLCLGGLEVNEFVWRNDKLWNYGAMRVAFAHEFGTDYLTQLDGQPHKKKRLRLNPSFRPDFLMSGAPQMSATARKNLALVAGQTIDLRQFCYRLLLRMTTQGMLGLDLSAEDEAAILQVEKDLLTARRFGPAWKLFFRRPVYLRAKKRVMAFLGETYDKWMADLDHAPPMFTLALRTAEGDEPPRRDELLGDIYLLMTGGLNSNANLLLWTLMYVFDRPEWVAQLQAEVAAVPPEQFSAMKQWPKIKASIQEIERLRPATVFNVLVPSADFEFQGIAFAKGKPITHFTTWPHFQEEIYENPLSFRPERHLEEKAAPAKAAHATFGGGSHMCIGMPLARLQTPLILAQIMQDYTVEFPVKPSFRPKLTSSLTPAGKQVIATIKKRG